MEHNFILSTGQISFTRITPNGILSGRVVCPNIFPMEFTCNGIEVRSLTWQRNETTLGAFTDISNEGEMQQEGPLTLILDSITTSNLGANMTSRLVGNIPSGDRVTCATSNSMDTVILDYTIKGKLIYYCQYLQSNVILTYSYFLQWL